MKLTTIQYKRVGFIPADLESGILYISELYETAAHSCCCGCGSKIVTPLYHGAWSLSEGKDGVSLWPSIGNGSFPCKSHYIIRNGQISWLKNISSHATSHAIMNDRRDAEHATTVQGQKTTLWRSIYQRIKSIFTRT